jgi:hypothetical protein
MARIAGQNSLGRKPLETAEQFGEPGTIPVSA